MKNLKLWLKYIFISVLLQLYALYVDKNDLFSNPDTEKRLVIHFLSLYLTPVVVAMALLDFITSIITRVRTH